MKKEERTMEEINDALCRLGGTRNYMCFACTAYALWLIRREPERLSLVTKWLYPDVAKQFGTNWKAVERNIRSMVEIVWRCNSVLLEQMARHPLKEKPRASEFLAIVSGALEQINR